MDRIDGALPPIPEKRYFTIGEVSDLCLVKPYVLRYWEQEFVQLKPMKRRGNRRYYQHHEVLLIRRIRELLYDQGFTISGARNQLAEMGVAHHLPDDIELDDDEPQDAPPIPRLLGGIKPSSGGSDARVTRALQASTHATMDAAWMGPDLPDLNRMSKQSIGALREALLSIRDLLS